MGQGSKNISKGIFIFLEQLYVGKLFDDESQCSKLKKPHKAALIVYGPHSASF
jgi:hypothetical protein